MRAPLVLAISVALLAACGQQSGPAPGAAQQQQAAQPAGPAPVPASATAVRGVISIAGLNQLPASLQLRLRLLDMSDPSVVPPVVAERIEPAPTSIPYQFALPYAPEQIRPDGRYVLDAALVSGEAVLYGTPNPSAVLTQGAGSTVEVNLERGGGLPPPDVAPADLLKQEFERVERSIGGMKRFNGERIENDITVGWDAFADSTGVRFARQVIDYDKAGTVSFRFAYKDGKPWVLAREKRGVVAHVGWGPDGSLVLNRDANDKTLDEAEVNELRSMAEALYAEASAKRGG